jgi:hypothetical protein
VVVLEAFLGLSLPLWEPLNWTVRLPGPVEAA